MPYIDERRSQTPTLEHAPTVPTETSVQTNAPACRRHTHAETHIRPRTISTTRERDCPTHKPPPSVTGTCTCTRGAHRATRAEAHARHVRAAACPSTRTARRAQTRKNSRTLARTHTRTHAQKRRTMRWRPNPLRRQGAAILSQWAEWLHEQQAKAFARRRQAHRHTQFTATHVQILARAWIAGIASVTRCTRARACATAALPSPAPTDREKCDREKCAQLDVTSSITGSAL